MLNWFQKQFDNLHLSHFISSGRLKWWNNGAYADIIANKLWCDLEIQNSILIIIFAFIFDMQSLNAINIKQASNSS